MAGSRATGLSAGEQWVERVLESSAVKALVVVLIAFSLAPHFDRPVLHFFVFLPFFGLEFALRLRLFLAHRRHNRGRLRLGEPVAPHERRRFEAVLLALDFVAVLSFLPLGHLFDSGRLLRLARLVRLVIVVRYAADLLRDFWIVVTRRERLGQLLLLLLTVATLSFVAAALLVYVEPDSPVHQGRLLDAFWWAFRQLESADNIVTSLHEHPGVVIASVLLTLTGIFLMAFLIGLGTNVVGALVVAARHRPLDLEGHTVLTAPSHAARRILRDLRRLEARNVPERKGPDADVLTSPARRLRRALGRKRIVLAGPDEEPPQFLLDPEFRGVLYRATGLSDPRSLDLVAADEARCVVLVPDEADPDADDRCLSSALAIGEAMSEQAEEDFAGRNPVPRDLFIQVRASANVPAAGRVAQRLHRAGVGCQVLDMEKLVGLFLTQHVMDPDLDPVFEELLATSGQAIWVRMAGEDFRGAGERWPRDLPPVVPHALAWRRHRVIPLGLLTAPDGEPAPRGASILRRTHGCGLQLGLGHGTARPPADRIAGVVALAVSEHPVRTWARDLAAGRLDGEVEPEPSAAASALAAGLGLAAHEARRVLLVGDHPAVPALVLELIRFLPGLEIRRLPEQPLPSVAELAPRFETALRRFDPDLRTVLDGDALILRLGDGKQGRVGLFPPDGSASAATLVLDAAALSPFDRVVFLSDPTVVGSDDRTTVRLLRTLDAGEKLEHCRLVVQVESESRANLLHAAAGATTGRRGRPRLSVLAAEQVRAHLLAHAMFTPGIVPVLDELFAERGQEIVRLEPPAGAVLPHERIGFDELLVALARRGPGAITALGWTIGPPDARVTVLNPPPDQLPWADEVRSVYAVADTRSLSGAIDPQRSDGPA